MADDVDRAQARIEAEEELRFAKAKQEAAAIPEGKPGDCELCGEWSERLVDGACAPCRDKYGLP